MLVLAGIQVGRELVSYLSWILTPDSSVVDCMCAEEGSANILLWPLHSSKDNQ